ncbi:MAG: PAS domain S-box protein, partial [Candidatus Hydrogenedentes bacterium]|nr:PAS domain S-box protein [Candidatus Hydrogenedentota bacterium]
MPGQTLTFRGIRLHLYALVAVALAVGLVLFGLFVALERRVRELGSVADDYHMASSALCERIRAEMFLVDKKLTALKFMRAASPGEASQFAAEVDKGYRQIAASAHVLTQSLEVLASLQEEFGSPVFTASTRRLLEHYEPLEMLTVRGVEYETYLESGLPDLSIVAEQLGRLHLKAHDDMVERIRAIRAENLVYFAAVSAVAFLIGIAASRRSIAGIRAIVAANEANQELLSESESRLRSILDATADGIITIDEHGIVVSFNNSASKMFGYGPEDMLGENVSILMPAPHQDEHDSSIKRYID